MRDRPDALLVASNPGSYFGEDTNRVTMKTGGQIWRQAFTGHITAPHKQLFEPRRGRRT